jgi:hypothetical protein
MAIFVIVDTDNKTYVDHVVETGTEIEPQEAPPTPTPQPKKKEAKTETAPPTKSFSAKEIIEIEKAKAASAKAISKLIKEYKALGYTNEEIRKKLG